MSALNQVISLVKPHVSDQQFANRKATRFFLTWFSLVSVVLYGGAYLMLGAWASPEYATACWFGMALCTLMSGISFFITEWAVDLPNEVFYGIAFGSVVVRIFTALFAFAIAQFAFHMHPIGMVVGMMTTYFSYLVIEIVYIHRKALKRGH